MNQENGIPGGVAAFIGVVREARFAAGLVCVHCASDAVWRWGRAHGRQRYRCRSCRRTFSDLTKTPYMYSKRLDCWPLYLGAIRSSASVRAAARAAAIAPSTSFRWRHALLEHVLEREAEPLRGIVEVTTPRWAYSEKGTREPAWLGRRLHVVFARDRIGTSYSLPLFADHPAGIAAVLQTRLSHDAIVYTDGRRYSGVGRFARRFAGFELGCARFRSMHPGDTSLIHVSNVVAEIRRYRSWEARFRGVATKYLQNYLAWHRRLDGTAEWQGVPFWVLAASRPPTHPANTTAGLRRGVLEQDLPVF